ncbi:hypothetical protein V6N11_015369 [Hibiscus sabdariffa]|uniref:Uncharacterized protein n=1 Tax=Hibiscus sabdariffa TaxID=183260 RepID=A0ABR2TSD1_9ROSI
MFRQLVATVQPPSSGITTITMLDLENVFIDDKDLVTENVDFCKSHLVPFPFLDATNTLLYPILALTVADYEELGYPGDIDSFMP